MVGFLNESVENGTIPHDSVEGIEVAIQCIVEAFNIDLSDESLSIAPNTLSKIFNVFLQTQAKLSATQTPDQLKSLGNKAMADKDYAAAISNYSQAILLDGENAVYYANRAAAYSQNNQHQLAVDDAKSAAKVDPGYSKAYSRMGHAYFCLGEYNEAVEAYEKGLALDPENATMRQSLETAKQKLSSVSARSNPADAIGSNPLAGMAGGAGGMPDLSSMLSNPALMNMASKMMSNPGMASMLQNPALMDMAKGFMNNPAAADMMRDPEALAKMMQGMGKKD